MKRVARLKTAPEELPSLGFRRGRVHRGPFRRQLGSSLKAPIGKGRSRVLPGALAAQVLEQPPPDHLSDLRFIVGNQILGNAPRNFRDLLLPLEIPVGHLDLAPRQADDRSSNFLARRGDFVPRLHQCVLRRRAGLGSSFRIWLRTREAMATAWRHSRIEISPHPGYRAVVAYSVKRSCSSSEKVNRSAAGSNCMSFLML